MKRLLFPVLAFVAVAVAACGGGGGSGGPQPVTTTTPSATPTVAPTSQSTVITLSTTATTPATLGAISLNGGTYVSGATTTFPIVNVTSTANVTMTSAVPTGVPTPAAGRIHLLHPSTLGVPNTPLLYFTVALNPGVTIAQTAAFTVNFTTAQTGSCYVVVYDPSNPSQGWNGLLGPQPCASTVTFPAIALSPSQSLAANVQYVFAIVTTSGVIVTPTPMPTPSVPPTPTASPTATPTPSGVVPAYCGTVVTPTPNAYASPQPVRIVDNSGIGGQAVAYVIVGADANGQYWYLGLDGALHLFSSTNKAAPLPLSCFPGSEGGTGQMLEIPPPPNQTNTGTNVFIALAPTPDPSQSAPPIPDPLNIPGSGTGSYTGPTTYFGSYYPTVPYDYIETGLPRGTVDTTQVDRVGLPLEISLLSGTSTVAGPVGFGVGAYNTFVSQLHQLSPVPSNYYDDLFVTEQFGTHQILAHTLNPEHGYLGFPQDLFFSGTYYTPPAGTSTSNGYIGYVMYEYQQTPQVYNLQGSPVSTGPLYYCASSDGTNINWWQVPQASCGTPPPTPDWAMNATTYLGPGQGDVYDCQSQILGQPWGPGSPLFSSLPAADFYLWKAMVVDLTRGYALAALPATHPYGGFPNSTEAFNTQFPAASENPLYSQYWRLLHENMDGGRAYAMAYDDLGGWDSGFTNQPNTTLLVTIQSLPAPPVVNPSPGPAPTNLSCPQ